MVFINGMKTARKIVKRTDPVTDIGVACSLAIDQGINVMDMNKRDWKTLYMGVWPYEKEGIDS